MLCSAICSLTNVQLAVLDEPFRGLDKSTRQQMLSNARSHWQKATLLCITHDIGSTLDFDRVIVIDDGRIMEQGKPHVLRRVSGSRYQRLLNAERQVQRGIWQRAEWQHWWLEDGRLSQKAIDEVDEVDEVDEILSEGTRSTLVEQSVPILPSMIQSGVTVELEPAEPIEEESVEESRRRAVIYSAYKEGILIQDPNVIDILGKVDAVVFEQSFFERSGILLHAQPTVVQIHTWADSSERSVLRYAAAAKIDYAHPVYNAISAAAQARKIVLPPVDLISHEHGRGRTITITDEQLFRRGNRLRVGMMSYMESARIDIPHNVREIQERLHTNSYTLILICLDWTVIGGIELAPSVRVEDRAAIAQIAAQGKEPYLLSSNSDGATNLLATGLGIEHYAAELLPEDWGEQVENLRAEGKTVCFVWDDPTHVEAIASADLSVAFSDGLAEQTLGAEAPDVLIRQRLSGIAQMFILGQRLNG